MATDAHSALRMHLSRPPERLSLVLWRDMTKPGQSASNPRNLLEMTKGAYSHGSQRRSVEYGHSETDCFVYVPFDCTFFSLALSLVYLTAHWPRSHSLISMWGNNFLGVLRWFGAGPHFEVPSHRCFTSSAQFSDEAWSSFSS